MCIRDRLCRFQPGGILEYVNEAYARAFGQKPEALVGRSFLCLLYTSDAADERSSVDLGGRRIIKKKKR